MDVRQMLWRFTFIWPLLWEAIPGSAEYIQNARYLVPIRARLGKIVYVADDEEEDLPDLSVTWQPGQSGNGSILVLGSSGSGKTEALKRIGYEIARHGIPLLILDFHGDVVIHGVSNVLLSSGLASTIGINPLQLTSFDPMRSGLVEQRLALVGTLGRAIPTLSSNQRAILAAALEEPYRWVGIDDNRVETWGYYPPTVAMVIEVLKWWVTESHPVYNRASVMGCINAVRAVFSHPVFNRSYNLDVISLLSACTRIDLSAVDDSIRFIVTETILRLVFAALRGQGPIPVIPEGDHERFRLFIMIDEAKILAMGKGDPNGRDRILNVLATEGRKFGVGLILASQTGRHFGEDVKGNVGARLTLRPADFNEAKANAVDIGVAPKDLLSLRGNGEGYFRQGAAGAVKMQLTRLQCPSTSSFPDL